MVVMSSRSEGSPLAPIGPHTIRHFTLSNGIKLIVQENHVSPSVVVRGHLWVGAICDPLEKMGLAHFTALGVVRGTATRTFQEINELTESVGANVLANAPLSPGLPLMLRELLAFHGHGFHTVDIPHRLVGKPVRELFAHFRERGAHKARTFVEEDMPELARFFESVGFEPASLRPLVKKL